MRFRLGRKLPSGERFGFSATAFLTLLGEPLEGPLDAIHRSEKKAQATTVAPIAMRTAYPIAPIVVVGSSTSRP
jgi:hypothetical protein